MQNTADLNEPFRFMTNMLIIQQPDNIKTQNFDVVSGMSFLTHFNPNICWTSRSLLLQRGRKQYIIAETSVDSG